MEHDSHLPGPRRGDGPPHVSATMVRDQLQLAKEIAGDDVVARAIARMPERARAEVTSLLPGSWCTLSSAYAMHEAIAGELGQELNAWHRTIVRAGVERTLTTVWRFFLRLTTMEAIVKRAASIYAKSYDRGAMRATLLSPGVVEVVLSEWHDVPDFELDAMVAGFDAVLSVAKQRRAHTTLERRPGGARFEVRLV